MAAVLIALMFGGVIPGFRAAKSSSSTPSPLDYTQAASVAKSTSDNSGGSWSVFSVAAVEASLDGHDPGGIVYRPVGQFDHVWLRCELGRECRDRWARDSRDAVHRRSGECEFRVLRTHRDQWSPSGRHGVERYRRILVTLTGLVCALLGEELHAAGANSLDSPQAIAVANAHGGATFLASHPQAARTWALTGTASALNLTQSDWNVVYTMCPTSGDEPAAPKPSFNATLSATSGAVLSSQTTNVTCGSFSLTNLTLGHLGSSVHHVHPLGTMSGFSLSWPGSGLPTGLGVAGKQ